MCQDVSDVYPSEVVPYVDHEPILVPANVEDRPTRTQKKLAVGKSRRSSCGDWQSGQAPVQREHGR